MTKAILVCWHKYTPFGSEFYEPMFSFFLQQMQKYKNEYDTLYLIDSTWEVNFGTYHLPPNVVVIKVDPNLRYYDAYKKALSYVVEDLVLFMDNDMVVYRDGMIAKTFDLLKNGKNFHGIQSYYDVVSIIDDIGTYKTDKLKTGNKFCPYWFATHKETLMKYLHIDWADHMPHSETLGYLTEVMLNDGLKPYELEDDKSNCLFDGTQDEERGKDLGYYHVRSGSTPAYLLATRDHGDAKTYWDYIKNQPKSEYLRQCAWYDIMITGISPSLLLMLIDMGVPAEEFYAYMYRFKKYHGLSYEKSL